MAEHDQTPDRPDHRRLGFVRRRRHPGRPQDLHRAGRLRRERADGAHGAEHARRDRASIRSRRDFVTQQIDAVAGDLRGGGREDRHARTTATRCWPWSRACGGIRLSPLVVDPVMVATSGDMLLEPDAVEAVRRELLPLADIITPNLPEAARLLHLSEAADEAEMEAQARAAAGARRQGRAAQGRARQRARGGRHPRHARRPAGAAGAAAHRYAQHPRHRLHAIGRHRRRPGARRLDSPRRWPRPSASSTTR